MNLLSQLKLVRWSRHVVVIILMVLLLTPAYLVALSLGKPSPARAADPGTLSFNAFNTGDSKTAGVPFLITITASNSAFNETVALSDGSGSISPSRTDNFVGGKWTGAVVITRSLQNNTITASYDAAHVVTSGQFTVSPNSAAASLSLVSGNGQSGVVATKLASALKVKTVDTYGNVLSGVNVQFNVTAYPPGATGTLLSATSATTGSDGAASTQLTLGTKVGTYAVQASVNNGASSVDFFVNATPAPLSDLSIVPSAAVVVQSSVQQFSLTATDKFGNPINLSSVNWAVVNGGGQIDNSGVFSASNVLGTFAGTVKASVGSISAAASVTVMPNTGFSTSGGNSSDKNDQRNIGLLDHVVLTPTAITAPTGSKQIVSAQGYDVFNNALATIAYTWEVSGPVGTLSTGYGPASLLQTPVTPGTGKLTVTAVQGDKKATATADVTIAGATGGQIVFSKIDSPKQAGSPFQVTFTVKDANGGIISSTPQPIILSDSTGTISPRVVTKLSAGVWTGEVTIAGGDEAVVLYAATSGFSGASNSFKVEGDSISPGGGGALGGGTRLLGLTDSNKVAFAIITGLGLLGAMTMLGLVGSRGLQAIGRNPLAKKQIFFNLYLNAGIAIIAAFISIALALLLKKL